MKTNNSLSREQARQEAEYLFPYHYIAQFRNGAFTQTLNLSWGYEYLAYLSFVADKLSCLKFNSLLDVGCGDGRFLSDVRNRFPCADLTGLDFSERAISFARILSPGVQYIAGDITNKMVLDKQFDIITAIEVIEHIPPEEIPGFFEGLCYFLKNRGIFIITVPSNNVRVRSKHYQHFDIKSLTEILNPYFIVVEKHFLNKTGFMTKLLKTLLTNKFFLLNSEVLLKAAYDFYRNTLLHAQEKNSKRIFLICEKRFGSQSHNA